MIPPPIRHRASSSALQQRRDGNFSPRPSSSFGTRARDSMALSTSGADPRISGAGGGSVASSANTTSVQVAVRIRPVTEHDQASIPTRWQRGVVQSVASNAILVDASGQPPPGQAVVSGAAKKHTFTFDRVYGPDDGQQDIYANTVQPLIGKFLEGYNVTVLAYGQTSSGKSYTMGTSLADVDFEGLVADQQPDPQTGIIPRAVAQIFEDIRQLKARSGSSIQTQAKASFVEIYNEELIDLLATEEGDSRPLVQIREDKAGHIIWSGLREMRVQNVADVMNYLLQGSAVRRTHETDMNAQSSRSHAIFSLTVSQRRYNGSPSSPSPAPPPSYNPRASMLGSSTGRTTPSGRSTPTGRSSGLPRPTSTLAGNSSRMSMIGRPHTPGRSSTSLGLVDDRSGDSEEWVTVTSKFHFVDLAGSERLKRTAAQGERVREGISINAGLHALGNVISALGDPLKSRKTTHIPYRDSKLTRLLQDSLGGNAFTCMIACVSPTEYNVSETVNTLQYANRARNIKNKAELNMVEVGWDDIDYLQMQVLKLRKELQILRGFKAGTAGSDAALRVMDQKNTLEWQERYAALSQKFTALTTEITSLRQSSAKDSSSNDDYYKAAEPIIVEYEKTVDALEGQINLMKAALGHSEDVIMAQEQTIGDAEGRIVSLENDLQVRERNMSALQERLVRLEQRERSADSYARELEVRLASHVTSGKADTQDVNEVRKELAKLRDADSSREQYIKELEARLADSDISVADLRNKLAIVEQDLERREAASEDLHRRLKMLDDSSESRAMLQELDQRQRLVLELEAKVDSIHNEKESIARDRGKLADTVAEHQIIQGKLEDQIRELKMVASVDSGTKRRVAESPGSFNASLPSNVSPASRSTALLGSQHEQDVSFLLTQVEMLSEELDSKRVAEQEAQLQLSIALEKHKEAIVQIQALEEQLSGMRSRGSGLNHLEGGRRTLVRRLSQQSLDSASRRGCSEGQSSDRSDFPTHSRRVSLTRRNSGSFLGYNPRESTPRDGVHTPQQPQTAVLGAMPPSHQSEDGSLVSKASLEHAQTLQLQRSTSSSSAQGSFSAGHRPLSLRGKEDFAKLGLDISNAGTAVQGSQQLSPAGGRGVSPASPLDLSRKVQSLEAETMRLQEALRERDEEIAALERLGRGHMVKNPDDETAVNAVHKNTIGNTLSDRRASGEVGELMRTMAKEEMEEQHKNEEVEHALNIQKEEQIGGKISDLPLSKLWPTDDAIRAEPAGEAPAVLSDGERYHQEAASLTAQHAKDLDELKEKQAKLTEDMQTAYELRISAQHRNEVSSLRSEQASVLDALHEKHDLSLARLKEELSEARQNHAKAVQSHQAESTMYQRDFENLQQTHVHALEQLETLKGAHNEDMRAMTKDLQSQLNDLSHSLHDAVAARDATASAHDDLRVKYQSLLEQDPSEVVALRAELNETSDALVTLEGALVEAQEQRDAVRHELERLKQESSVSAHVVAAAQAHKSAENLQSTLGSTRAELQRVKSDLQGMMEDKARQESLVREMQIKLTIAETRSASAKRSAQPGNSTDTEESRNSTRPPLTPRQSSSQDRDMRLSTPTSKQPPLTPPPNMPPPPTPTNGTTIPTQLRSPPHIRTATSPGSSSHGMADSVVSGDNRLSRSSSAASMHAYMTHSSGISAPDAKTAKLLSEQADEIKSLARQLNHCEQDLQANIDLVATLEAALNDSERNLRKSRVQLSEAARERDRYASQINELKQQIDQAQRETDSVRNSVLLEKQGYESQLQHEREAKERARRALESRLEEVNKKKNGRLFCM